MVTHAGRIMRDGVTKRRWRQFCNRSTPQHRKGHLMIKLIEPLELRIFLAAIGPDDYGYAADGTTYEDINLVAGDAGVVDIADLNLAGNTFNFYGHVYSAADQFTVYRRGL